MPPLPLQRLLIAILLGVITVSAFFIRLDNFKNSYTRSIDEVVYYRMAKQVLTDGLGGYNTISYGRELAEQGRSLPDYFFQPIYKYPPLFTMLIAQSIKMFGPNDLGVGFVPLLAGAILTPLTYLLGTLIANRFVGFLAAFLVTMDPVVIICSQKVWPETTLALFTLISIVSFIKALKSKYLKYFLMSGLFCGLAANTKYPGLLMAPIGLLFAYLQRRDLLHHKVFLTSMFLPLLTLVPWALWNWIVYQENFLRIQMGLHSFGIQTEMMSWRIMTVVILGIALALLNYYRKRQGIVHPAIKTAFPRQTAILLLKALIILIVVAEADSIGRAFQINILPSQGWSAGMFAYEWASFYFGRLVEFSPLYLLSFASFLFLRKELTTPVRCIQYAALGQLFFYILWGNYQSRYILACLPLFLVLTGYFILVLTQQSLVIKNFLGRNILLLTLVIFIFYAMTKTGVINQHISFPNDLCYF